MNLNVSLDFVSGNIEILGKQNSLFPSGPVIKCLLFSEKEDSNLRLKFTPNVLEAYIIDMKIADNENLSTCPLTVLTLQ